MKNSVVKNSVVKNLIDEKFCRWKISVVKSAVGEKYGGEMRHAIEMLKWINMCWPMDQHVEFATPTSIDKFPWSRVFLEVVYLEQAKVFREHSIITSSGFQQF